MSKRYDPTKTDQLPPRAQTAFEACEIAIREAEELLLERWLKLPASEWTATQKRLEEWAAAGHRRSELFRHAIEMNEYDRGAL